MNLKPSRVLYIDAELTTGDNTQIVQVGVVEADTASLQIVRENSWYVKPEGEFVISEFLTGLTGITEKMIHKARPFREVQFGLAKFGPKNKTTFAWGNDRDDFAKAYSQLEMEFPFNFIDLGWQFRNMHAVKHGVSLTSALAAYGLQFEGRQHHALHDARNLARLHLEMLRRIREWQFTLIPSSSTAEAQPSSGSTPATCTPTV